MSDFEKQDFHPIARVYEDYFVPALFQPWAARTLDAAQVQAGQRVLDVACGTGVVTRGASARVGGGGSVIGLDISPGMLAVAEHKAPEVEWRQGDACALPFEDRQFDAVVSQFGLMFFSDRPLALREMMRVLRPGGHVAVTVWNSLDHIPGFAGLVDLLLRLFGEDAANEMRPPFSLGNTQHLKRLFDEAGIDATITTYHDRARFPSIESWVYTNIKGWVLADMIDDAQYALLRDESERSLKQYVTAEGSVELETSAHIVTAVKR